MTPTAEHRLPALARHRPLRPAVRPSGGDAEHPAPRRPGPAVPQGVLRRADLLAAAVPRCSPAATAARNGMIGLAHRGFALDDPGQHLVHTLRDAGYWTAMVGEQHVSRDPASIGYDLVADARHQPRRTTSRPAAVSLLRDAPARAVLPLGRASSRRTATTSSRRPCATRCTPTRPANLPDTPVTRRDMAAFKQSARTLDHGRRRGARARSTRRTSPTTPSSSSPPTTGSPFPGAKATLSDRGLGVLLMMRGPGRLPRRPRHRRAGLADRPLPDAVRARRDRAARPSPGPLAAAARARRGRARSTTRSTPS